MNANDTSSDTPNEEFFIRKFSSQKEDEPILTSEILRREERLEFARRFSSPVQEYHLHIRDFKTVCRGESLVSTMGIPISHKSSGFTGLITGQFDTEDYKVPNFGE